MAATGRAGAGTGSGLFSAKLWVLGSLGAMHCNQAAAVVAATVYPATAAMAAPTAAAMASPVLAAATAVPAAAWTWALRQSKQQQHQ